jgi:hypothetical protein
MAQLTTDIPDDLEKRVRSHLEAHGEDLASFTARAFDELLAVDDDRLLSAELARKTRDGLHDVDAGRVTEARQAARNMASELGLKFRR